MGDEDKGEGNHLTDEDLGCTADASRDELDRELMMPLRRRLGIGG